MKISVVMGVYNSERHLRESIQSILSQTFSDFELIVINDGSTDSTLSVIGEFKDPRIVVKSIPHSGLTKALNVGLQTARGEFIARMDADDVAFPERFQKQIQFLIERPDVGLVGTGYEVLLDNKKKVPATVPLLKTDHEIKAALPKFNPFFHGSVMMRKSTLSATGFYDETFLLAQDYDLWLRVSKKHKLANLAEVLMWRREGKQTLEKEKRQNWYAIRVRIKAIRQQNLSPLHSLYLVRPFLVMITPNWIKSSVRFIMCRQHDQN